MNFDGTQAYPVKRFGGSADYDDPTLIPPGLATVCRNMRFRKTSVRTRDGSKHTMSFQLQTGSGDITGLDVLEVLIPGQPQTQVILAMSTAQVLLRELPPGSGTLVSASTPFPLPAGASMQTAKAYNKIHMAVSDLSTPLLPPMAIDGRSNTISPVSQNPVGAPWDSEELYSVGDLIRSPDGRWWRNIAASLALGSPQGPQFPVLNGQFIGTPLSSVSVAATVVTPASTVTPFGTGPFYVYVVNGSQATQFIGPFPCYTFSNGSGSTHFLGTFQVNIPADPGASTWTIYIGTSPNLAAMTRSFTVIGTTNPQTFTAEAVPANVAAPGTPAGVWSPSTVTESVGGSQWEEWTPNCVNKLPAPDVANTATVVTHSPGSGAIASGKDVYVKLAFRSGLGESPRSIAVAYVNTSANDQITISFGNNGGIRIPRWIAAINLQPTFFNPITLDVWIAVVATGASVPADTAYNLYAVQQSLGASIVISGNGTGPTINSPTAASGNFSNPTLAYDGNLNTVSFGAAGTPGFPSSMSEIWSGFASGTAAGQSLHVKSQAVFENGPPLFGNVALDYSLDGGSTWHNVYSVQVTRSLQIDTIPLTNGQDLTQVQVRATSSSFGGSTQSPYIAVSAISEIWIDFSISPLGVTAGPAFILSTSPAAPPVFVGEAGTRYMAILRADSEASLSPIDPGNPIALQFNGQSSANIISISRDGSGNITATLSDVSEMAIGHNIVAAGCLGDATLNGPGTLTSVETTVDPQGIVAWSTQVLSSASQDNTGSVILPAEPPPIAFLPPAGPLSEEYVAAFTVVGAQQAGPFFYISEAVPDAPISTAIVNSKGGVQVTQNITSLTRSAGGYVQCNVANISGFSAGQTVSVQGTPLNPDMEGDFTLSSVVPTSGTAGNLFWLSPATASGTSAAVGTVTAFAGTIDGVQVVVQNAAGLSPGQYVFQQNPAAAQFNGLGVIAAVKGNTVTVSMVATGSATGGTLAVVPILPTVTAAQVPTIVSITRDASGNVTAQVGDTGGFTPGEIIYVAGVADATYGGLFQLTGVTVNTDGISGTLIWMQTGQSAGASSGGTITASPFPIINFDDNSLSSSVDNDVTAQLTAVPAPEAVDIYYSPSLDMMVYTTGLDSDFYFSDAGDPANIQSPGGILGVDRTNGKRTVCFREMINGELIGMKENAGYAITPGSVSANKWGVSKRWDEHGPCGVRAVAVGPDFMIIFDENSGPYRYYRGELAPVGLEKQGTWDRLNKNAKSQVCVVVDDNRKEVRFLLPLDGATVPNKELTLNYFNGWNEPLMLTLSGEEMPDPHGRRWSEDDRPARFGKLLDRDLATPVDVRIDHRQMLYGMESDGTNDVYVDMTVPDQFDDNGKGIDCHYQPAYISSPTGELLELTACKGRAKGSGMMNLQPTTVPGTSDFKVRTVDLTNDTNDVVPFARGIGNIKEELITLECNNGAVADAWFELQMLTMYVKAVSSGRAG